MAFIERLSRRSSQVSQPAPGKPDDKTTPSKERSRSVFGRRTLSISTGPSPRARTASPSPWALGGPTSPAGPASSSRRLTERSASTVQQLSPFEGSPSALPDVAWLDEQAKAPGSQPKKDVVVLGRVLWKHGTTFDYVRSALSAYHECPSDDLGARLGAIAVLSSAVDKYLEKTDGRHTAAMRKLAAALEDERRLLANRIRDAIQARHSRTASVADLLDKSALLAEPDQPGEATCDTPLSDSKSAYFARSPSTSVSTTAFSKRGSSDVLDEPEDSQQRDVAPEYNLFARSASPTKLISTLPTSGLLHASLLTTGATRSDGALVKPDVEIGGMVIRKKSTTMKRVLESLDRYHALQPYQLLARKAALAEVQKNVAAYMAKPSGRYKQAPAFQNFQAKFEQESHIVTSLLAINVEAEWQRDQGSLPAVSSPEPQLNAQDAADLLRAGVPSTTIARGMAMHLSREQIVRQLAPCARARIPYTAPTQEDAYQSSALVPESIRKLGRGAVNTAWRVDFRDGDRIRAMVFKPEPSIRVDIGEMAKASGIPPAEANLSGRSAAAYACSKALGLDVVPPTVVAIVDIDASPEAGSLMEFVEGFQLVSEGSAKRPLTAEQARLLAAHPEILQAYARECGCTSAKLDGTTLQLERRILVDYDREGMPLARGQRREIPGIIRMAVSFHDGRLRRLMADAQLLSRFIRDGDRSPMNIMFTLSQEGQLEPRFIDNDVTFGPEWTVRSEPGTSVADRRVELPGYASRALKNAFDRLSRDLGQELEALLGDASLAVSVLRDVAYVKALLATYDMEGRILDADADWEQPAVTEALGLHFAGEEFRKALGACDTKGAPSYKKASAHIGELERLASRRSYLAREAMAQQALAIDWAAVKVGGLAQSERPEELFSLDALFDFDELMRHVRAASARADAGRQSPPEPSTTPSVGKPSSLG